MLIICEYILLNTYVHKFETYDYYCCYYYGFEWFWMESLHKNIQLMLEFLKAPFLVLHFSCSTLMTFLTMLSVLLLSMLIIILFALNVTRQQLELASELESNLNETLWTGPRSGLLISMLGKLSWFRLTGLIIMVLLMWNRMGLFLSKNHLLRCLVWPSPRNWIGVLALSLLLRKLKL